MPPPSRSEVDPHPDAEFLGAGQDEFGHREVLQSDSDRLEQGDVRIRRAALSGADDDRGWVLSVAHLAVVSAGRLESRLSAVTRPMPTSRPGRLPHDHAGIVVGAVGDMQPRYAAGPDPDGLLGDEFTLRDLRLAHEAVAGEPLQRDRFPRVMESRLEATGRSVAVGRGRPAELFRRLA